MTMPAGRYYVGDLCYVMHPQWNEFCDLTIKDNKCLDGEFELSNGVKFAHSRTAYGDGVYEDLHGREYHVDAGLIGCIKESDVDDPNAHWAGGNIIDFEAPFEIAFEDGDIVFYNADSYKPLVEIPTGHVDDYDDEGDDYEDDE